VTQRARDRYKRTKRKDPEREQKMKEFLARQQEGLRNEKKQKQPNSAKTTHK